MKKQQQIENDLMFESYVTSLQESTVPGSGLNEGISDDVVALVEHPNKLIVKLQQIQEEFGQSKLDGVLRGLAQNYPNQLKETMLVSGIPIEEVTNKISDLASGIS